MIRMASLIIAGAFFTALYLLIRQSLLPADTTATVPELNAELLSPWYWIPMIVLFFGGVVCFFRADR